MTAPEQAEAEQDRAGVTTAGWVALGAFALAALTRYLETAVPATAAGPTWKGFAAAVEYPVYAIVLGLLGNAVLTAAGVRDRLAGGFRTEFFIKTGLVLLARRSTCR